MTSPGDRILLIVEDDVTFARIMVDVAHSRAMKALVALRGATALTLVREFKPNAITLDVRLPDMSGWSLLDRLKHDSLTAHIPVHIVSGHEENRRGFKLGAASCLQKVLTKETLEEAFEIVQKSMAGGRKNVLLVGESDVRLNDIRNLINGPDLNIIQTNVLDSAMQVVNSEDVHTIILDWVLPDKAGFEFIESVQSKLSPYVPPIIVSGTPKLSEEEIAEIHNMARSSAVRYAPSIERVFAASVLLLHRNERELSEEQREVLEEVRQTDPPLAGRKVLVIDDDLRNIFALTSVLEQRQLQVLHAENGRTGIEMLKSARDVDIVLMDVMMPEMDGYETTRAIRQIPEFSSLPIIALTAKAMKGDREKCLLAGASDYVTKPVDLEQLFSVMRVWITRDDDARFEMGALSVPNWLSDQDAVVDDDRYKTGPGDHVLLVVEDDPTFARIMVDRAHKNGAKVLVALRGSTALALAREFRPHAITLDIKLPDMSGWTVLDLLKHDPVTRHIPVHVISSDENSRRGFMLGAMTCAQKAPDTVALDGVFNLINGSMEDRTRKIMLVTASARLRQEIYNFVGGVDVQFTHVSSTRESLHALAVEQVDCIILDWVLSEIGGTEFIEKIQSQLAPHIPPVIVLGSRKLSSSQAAELHTLSRTSAVRYAPSLERLLEESVLALHRPEDSLSEFQKEQIAKVRQNDPILAGCKVLVVDDDIRNIFALTSVLERHQVEVFHAENGRGGIEVLESNPDINLVLMDIMMPEMDGYETTRAVRQDPRFESLPIIALTAKAMKGDREKCLQAGATDYVTKPVDLDHLFSVMRVCLSRSLDKSQVLGDRG
jgi:CheY-like chemotaxis protein